MRISNRETSCAVSGRWLLAACLYAFVSLWIEARALGQEASETGTDPTLMDWIDEALVLADEDRGLEALALLEFLLDVETSRSQSRATFHLLHTYVLVALQSGVSADPLEEPLFRLAEMVDESPVQFAGLRAELDHLFALWFLAKGSLDNAAKMLASAADAALAANRPVRAVDYFLALSDVYITAGQSGRLRQLWSRLDTLLFERAAELDAALIERVQEYRNQAAQTERIPAERYGQGGIDLQPVLTLAAIAEDEIPRSLATLTNTSSLPRTGALAVRAAKGYAIAWERTGLVHKVTLEPAWWAQAGTSDAETITLAPGAQARIYVACEPSSLKSVAVDLVWTPAGDDVQSIAKHQFLFAPDRRPAAFVSASEFEWNASYPVPVFTELVHRVAEEIVHDFRAVAGGRRCRVEYLDEATGDLLAIDGEGDGSFSGPSDSLIQDANRDGFPDFTLSPMRPVAGLEMLVFPHADGTGDVPDTELALSFHTRKSSLRWKTRDANVMTLRSRFSP